MINRIFKITFIFIIVIASLINSYAESNRSEKMFKRMKVDSSKLNEYYKSMYEHQVIHDPKARIGNFLNFKADEIKNHALQIDSSRMYRRGLLKKNVSFTDTLQDSVMFFNFFNNDTLKIVVDTTFKTELGIVIGAHTLGSFFSNVTISISAKGRIDGFVSMYKTGKSLIIHTIENGVLIGIEQDATDTTVQED